EGGLEPLPFHVLANAVRIDDVVEKRRRGDMRIILPVVLCCRRTWKVHEEGKHTIEHGSHFGFSQSSLKVRLTGNGLAPFPVPARRTRLRDRPACGAALPLRPGERPAIPAG